MSPEPIYSFEIDRSLLAALALFQSSDETRIVLNATRFEIKKNGLRHELTLVATDGKRIATHCDEIAAIELTDKMPNDSAFIVDLKGVKKLPKVKGEYDARVTVFEKHAVFSCGKFRYEGKFVDDNYPNWRQVFPSQEPIAISEFPVNFQYLASFGAAAKLITEKPQVVLHAFGDGAAIGVTFPGYRQFRGVVMPIRLNADDDKGVTRTESKTT